MISPENPPAANWLSPRKTKKNSIFGPRITPRKRVLLFREDTVFVQTAAISHDDNWIAVEHGGSSLGHSILIFKRDRGLIYKMIDGGDNSLGWMDKVCAMALQSRGNKEDGLDHTYLHPSSGPRIQMADCGAGRQRQRRVRTHVQITNWRAAAMVGISQYGPVRKPNPGKVEVSGK